MLPPVRVKPRVAQFDRAKERRSNTFAINRPRRSEFLPALLDAEEGLSPLNDKQEAHSATAGLGMLEMRQTCDRAECDARFGGAEHPGRPVRVAVEVPDKPSGIGEGRAFTARAG
jgi:hypothetical protein